MQKYFPVRVIFTSGFAQLLAALLVWMFLSAGIAPAAPATSPPRVLILDETVVLGASSWESLAAQAALPGCAVDIVSAASWYGIPKGGLGGPTGFGFDQYRAVIVGDPGGMPGSAAYLSALNALNATQTNWIPACAGNVILLGMDNAHHATSTPTNGAFWTVHRGVAFAANDPAKTGFYYSLSSYYDYVLPAVVPLVVPHLAGFGRFEVRNYPGVCFDDAHIVATHPVFTTPPALSDAHLSGWNCSVHEGFDVWPPGFVVLAIALTNGAYTASDGSNGVPYVLVRGEGVMPIGPITLGPANATNDLGTTHTVCAAIATNVIPHAGVAVTFTIGSGPNSVTNYTTLTDSNGVACFTYAGNGGLGVDYISASYTNSLGKVLSSGTVTKLWVGACVNLGCPAVECLSDGTWSYSFCITNIGANPMNFVSLFNPPPGVSFVPGLITLSPPLNSGQSRTVSLLIHGPITLSNICFKVGAHTTNEVIPSCSIPNCIDLPTCCNRILANSLTFAGTVGSVSTYNYSITLQNVTGSPLKFVGFGADQPCVSFVPPMLDLTLPAYGGGLLLPGMTRTLNLQVKRTAPCASPNTFHLSTFGTNLTACCSSKVTLPPPTVKIISPFDGSVMLKNTAVLVRAISLTQVALRWVKFYDGETYLGDATPGTLPGAFDLTVSNLPPGLHHLTAVAELDSGTTESGAIESSDPVELTVVDPIEDPDHDHEPPTLSVGVTGSSVLLSLPTSVGHSYTIEYSTNLATGLWQTLQLIDGPGGTVTVTEPVANDRARFYRASRRQP